MALFACLMFSASCQKDMLEQVETDVMSLSDLPVSHLSGNTSTTYYGPETYKIVSKGALIEKLNLYNPDFSLFGKFVLTVQNGSSGNTRVNKLEIRIDGELIITHSDFKKNKYTVTKKLDELTSESRLEVRLEGSRGRFIIVKIEGEPATGTISDIEGNSYKTVKIGEQWWMAENLKTTRFADGTPITYAPETADWIALDRTNNHAYCWYNNDSGFKNIYGALYNSFAVHSSKEICPDGWHIPDDGEWYQLCLFLDPDAVQAMGVRSPIAGGLLKEAGTSHWESPNTGATNTTGFTALPGGKRGRDGSFINIGKNGTWWSDFGYAYTIMDYNTSEISFSEGGEQGFSVRCLKN
jgi:uncharacterized protein (TIGR02145 family)